MLHKMDIDPIIMMALKEDLGLGDITTDNLINENSISKAVLIAKEDGIIAGLDVFERVFKVLDENVEFERNVKDGQFIKYGDIIIKFRGNSRVLLKGERTALNFLQRLSGVANRTKKLADLVREYNVKVVDTRKTTPGLRLLEKYAVKVGGGSNHRFNLSDGVLIKDNHIKAAGSITKAVTEVRNNIPHTIKIEVETETLDMVREALECKADIIMLDNMSLDMMKRAVELIDKRALVEASGDIDEEKIIDVAKTGVDIISIGRITHSVRAFNISMRFVD